MHRALASATGLPSRSVSALWMLVFWMPAEVSRNFMGSFLIGGSQHQHLHLHQVHVQV
jgi:hypothetical protein